MAKGGAAACVQRREGEEKAQTQHDTPRANNP